MKIAITGHRPNKLGNDYDLTGPLIHKIRDEIIDVIYNIGDFDNITLITGMALGIDTLFAKIAIECNLPFIAAVPCFDQEKMWKTKSQKEYKRILLHELCQEVVIVSLKAYDHSVMQIRNEWMVDNCDKLIAVWDGTDGGTANCVRYAKDEEKEIIRINPKKL